MYPDSAHPFTFHVSRFHPPCPIHGMQVVQRVDRARVHSTHTPLLYITLNNNTTEPLCPSRSPAQRFVVVCFTLIYHLSHDTCEHETRKSRSSAHVSLATSDKRQHRPHLAGDVLTLSQGMSCAAKMRAGRGNGNDTRTRGTDPRDYRKEHAKFRNGISKGITDT